MIAGILLAAGDGRRFGAGAKPLAPLPDGTPVAAAAAVNLLAGGIDRCLAVTRPGDTELAHLLRETGVQVVTAPERRRSLGTSIAAGVAAAGHAEGWLIALADMPWIAPATTAAVADALQGGALLARPHYRGREGHPVGFTAALGAELRTLDGEPGGRRVIAAHRDQLAAIPVDDPGVLRDVDRSGDLGAAPRPPQAPT